MTYTIRPLTLKDAAAFQALRLTALRDEPSAFASSYEREVVFAVTVFEDWLAHRPTNLNLGAFVANQLVGTTMIRQEFLAKQAHKMYVWGVYVKPSGRRKGIARALMQECIEFSRSLEGVDSVTLSVEANNVGARSLYESLGFVAWGREPQALRVGAEYFDEVHMALTIRQA